MPQDSVFLGEATMPTAMSQIKANATAHMKRDMDSVRKWTCQCADCRELRSLVGVDKLLEVRPLIREIEQIELQLRDLAEGPECQRLTERYLALYDELADAMAK